MLNNKWCHYTCKLSLALLVCNQSRQRWAKHPPQRRNTGSNLTGSKRLCRQRSKSLECKFWGLDLGIFVKRPQRRLCFFVPVSLMYLWTPLALHRCYGWWWDLAWPGEALQLLTLFIVLSYWWGARSWQWYSPWCLSWQTQTFACAIWQFVANSKYKKTTLAVLMLCTVIGVLCRMKLTIWCKKKMILTVSVCLANQDLGRFISAVRCKKQKNDIGSRKIFYHKGRSELQI